MAIFFFQQYIAPTAMMDKPMARLMYRPNFSPSDIFEHGPIPTPHKPGLFAKLHTARM